MSRSHQILNHFFGTRRFEVAWNVVEITPEHQQQKLATSAGRSVRPTPVS